ncbi:hypothetical protein V6N13_137943 [Hibiscus sabdariffa]
MTKMEKEFYQLLIASSPTKVAFVVDEAVCSSRRFSGNACVSRALVTLANSKVLVMMNDVSEAMGEYGASIDIDMAKKEEAGVVSKGVGVIFIELTFGVIGLKACPMLGYKEYSSLMVLHDYTISGVGSKRKLHVAKKGKYYWIAFFAKVGFEDVNTISNADDSMVGSESNSHYPPNKVMIWDDNHNRCIGELSFCSEVRSVRLRRD